MPNYLPFFRAASLVLLGGFITSGALAQGLITVTKCYNGPTVTVDGVGNYGETLPSVTFTTTDFPSNAVITDVNITINFNKTDGSCAAPGTGNSFHGETSFQIVGPNGTVILAPNDTWSGAVSISNVDVTFDQSATMMPSGTPMTGIFLPAVGGGNLDTYNGSSPLGNWNLDAGDDAGGDPLCVNSYCVEITACVPPTITIDLAMDASCDGASDGAATVSGSATQAPYSYEWSTGDLTAAITGLDSGLYTVTVTDANGCGTFTVVDISDPDTIETSIATVDLNCFGDSDGSATVTATGGTMPYTFAWSNGQTAMMATGLSVGEASVAVTDANGCAVGDTTVITQPDELVATIDSVRDVACEGDDDGLMIGSATGGNLPYFWLWDDPGAQVTSTAVNLAEGMFTATVTDLNGCTTTVSETVEAEFASPTLDLGPNVIANGTAVQVSAPTGFASYQWSNGLNTATITVFASGTYTLTVTNDDDCAATDEIDVTGIWPTGVSEPLAEANLSVYPNPTAGEAMIGLQGLSGQAATLTVVDPLGRPVLREQLGQLNANHQHPLDLSGQAAGLYLVRVEVAGQGAVLRLLLE